MCHRAIVLVACSSHHHIYLLHPCVCQIEKTGRREGKESVCQRDKRRDGGKKESLIILFAYSRSTVSLRLIFVVVSFTIISTMGIVNFSEIKVTFFGTL